MTAASAAARAIAVLALLGGAAACTTHASEPPPTATAEAYLAHGITRSGGSDVLGGLGDLQAAAELRPQWREARQALGIALLRVGRFEAASRELTEALGKGLADALASGAWRAGTDDAAGAAAGFGSPDPEALLGLATALHFMGDVRRAEHLYRSYADLMGPMSTDAGRAYYRLHEMFRESGSEWGDADAELAKALAVDPDVGGAGLLPRLIDPRERPELEPYTRTMQPAGDRPDTTVTYDSLPVLVRWSPPGDTSAASVALTRGELAVRIHVGADGVPVGAEACDVAADETTGPAVEAVMNWLFEPARSDGESVAAWILFDSHGNDETGREQEE